MPIPSTRSRRGFLETSCSDGDVFDLWLHMLCESCV